MASDAASTASDAASGAASTVASAASSAMSAIAGVASSAVETAKESLGASDKPEGPLFSAPEGEGDELTDIKGIGPVAKQQLNEQGITTFRQIAELSADDVKRIDDYMPFSAAQIEDWQAQAKEKVGA